MSIVYIFEYFQILVVGRLVYIFEGTGFSRFHHLTSCRTTTSFINCFLPAILQAFNAINVTLLKARNKGPDICLFYRSSTGKKTAYVPTKDIPSDQVLDRLSEVSLFLNYSESTKILLFMILLHEAYPELVL